MESEKRKKGLHGIPAGFIGMREMCRLFGRSPKSIGRMVAMKTLPRPLKFGRQNIWDRKEIENWLRHAKFTK